MLDELTIKKKRKEIDMLRYHEEGASLDSFASGQLAGAVRDRTVGTCGEVPTVCNKEETGDE